MRWKSLLAAVAISVAAVPAFAFMPTPFDYLGTSIVDARGSSHGSVHLSATPSAPSVVRVPSPSFTPKAPATTPQTQSVLRAPTTTTTPQIQSQQGVMRAPLQATPGPTTTQQGVLRPGQPLPQQQAATPPKAPVVLPQSAVDKNIARGQSQASLQAFKASQIPAPKPAVDSPQTRQQAMANPAVSRYATNWHSSDQYFASRNAALGRLPPQQQAYWAHPPAVIIVRPSYGGYSAAFYGTLLGYGVATAIDASYYNWAYAHRYDPAYVQWHADIVAQAQQNAEVQEKLAALDAQMAQMQQQGVVGNPNVELPNGVDPSMAVAPETAMLATSVEETAPGGLGFLGWSLIIAGVLVTLGVVFAMFGRKTA